MRIDNDCVRDILLTIEEHSTLCQNEKLDF